MAICLEMYLLDVFRCSEIARNDVVSCSGNAKGYTSFALKRPPEAKWTGANVQSFAISEHKKRQFLVTQGHEGTKLASSSGTAWGCSLGATAPSSGTAKGCTLEARAPSSGTAKGCTLETTAPSSGTAKGCTLDASCPSIGKVCMEAGHGGQFHGIWEGVI